MRKRSFRAAVALAVASGCVACGEVQVFRNLMALSTILEQRYQAPVSVNLSASQLTVVFKNSEYADLAPPARERFAWDVARFTYGLYPGHDTLRTVSVGFASTTGGGGFSVTRGDAPYTWTTGVLGSGGAAPPSSGEVATDRVSADLSCGFIRANVHADPDSLVREVLARDGRGEFLRRSGWLDSASVCPDHLPAPDAFIVTSGYTLTPGARDSSTARYDVVYRHLGYVSSTGDSTRTLEFNPHLQSDTLHFVLVRTSFGWRLYAPDLPQHVLADAARGVLPPSARQRLDSTARVGR